MRILKPLSILYIVLLLIGCESNSPKYPPPPLYLKLYSKAMALMPYVENHDSCKKAIDLLDSVTILNKDDFNAYYNKVPFLCSLGEFTKAITAIESASKLKPEAHDLYLISGILHRKIYDTSIAQQHFLKSLSICNAVLDTMHSSHSDYLMLQGNRILLYVMLNDRRKVKHFMSKLDNIKIETKEREQLRQLSYEDRDTVIAKLLSPKNYRH